MVLIQSKGNQPSKFGNFFLNTIAAAEIIDLLRNETLNLEELHTLSREGLQAILYNEDIISALRDGSLEWETLSDLYYTYFDTDPGSLGDFDILQLIELWSRDKEEFDTFYNIVGIHDTVEILKQDGAFISALAEHPHFLEDHWNDIDLDTLLELYHLPHSNIFHDLITDEENILHDTGVSDFIEKYKECEKAIEKAEEEKGYGTSRTNAYDMLVYEVNEEGAGSFYDSGEDEDEYHSHNGYGNYNGYDGTDVDSDTDGGSEDDNTDTGSDFGSANDSEDEESEEENNESDEYDNESDDESGDESSVVEWREHTRSGGYVRKSGTRADYEEVVELAGESYSDNDGLTIDCVSGY